MRILRIRHFYAFKCLSYIEKQISNILSSIRKNEGFFPWAFILLMLVSMYYKKKIFLKNCTTNSNQKRKGKVHDVKMIICKISKKSRLSKENIRIIICY